MDYRKMRFLLSAPNLLRLPRDHIPEVAFIGRSNAGKSSALNALANQRQLAKSSKTPGRTQHINLFQVEKSLRLVDLPGYGFSKVTRSLQQHWEILRSQYLRTRSNLMGLVLLMDIRHPFQPLDIQLLDQLQRNQQALAILLTKADKLSSSQRQQSLRRVVTALEQRNLSYPVILFSSTQSFGIDDLRTVIVRMIT